MKIFTSYSIWSHKWILVLLLLITSIGFVSGQDVSLHVDKVGPVEASPGEKVTYRIYFWNTGANLAVDATIVDNLPPANEFTFDQATNGVQLVGRTLTWTKNELTSLASVSADKQYVEITGWYGKKGNMPVPGLDSNSYYMPTDAATTTVTNTVKLSRSLSDFI